MATPHPLVNDSVFTGIPVDVPPSLEEGIFSGVPLNENEGTSSGVFTALPLRRRRTPTNSSGEEDEASEVEDDHNDRRSPWHTTVDSMAIEALCWFVVVCVVIFSDFRISVPRLFPRSRPILKDLNAESLPIILQKKKYALVYFEAPWGRADPSTKIQVAERLAGYHQELATVQVDCEEHPEICRAHTILDCPTIRFYAPSWRGNHEFPSVTQIDETLHSTTGLVYYVRHQHEIRSRPWWNQFWKRSFEPGPYPGPIRPNHLTQVDVTKANFPSALPESEGTGIVVYPGRNPHSHQWWIRIWEDQDAFLKREGIGAKIFLADGSQFEDSTFRLYHNGVEKEVDYQNRLLPTSSIKIKTNNEKAPELTSLTYSKERLESLVDNMDPALPLLVVFHDPTSNTGKVFAQTMFQVENRLKGEDHFLKIVHFQVTDAKDQALLRKDQHITKFPSIRFYELGQVHEFQSSQEGVPTESALVSFCRECLSHATIPLETALVTTTRVPNDAFNRRLDTFQQVGGLFVMTYLLSLAYRLVRYCLTSWQTSRSWPDDGDFLGASWLATTTLFLVFCAFLALCVCFLG